MANGVGGRAANKTVTVKVKKNVNKNLTSRNQVVIVRLLIFTSDYLEEVRSADESIVYLTIYVQNKQTKR